MSEQASSTTVENNVPRERLEGLMLFRVVLVTIFLGSALAVDVEALSSLSEFKNAVILSLIVGTYLLTILYSVLVRKLRSLERLAAVQITLDLLITAILVDVTGGLDSAFLFLFHLNIINAAIVLGRHAALYAATATTVIFAIFGVWHLSPAAVASVMAFRVAVNGAAAFTVALLAGSLAERLGEATTQLAEQELNIRELKALNENILASLSSGLLTVDDDLNVIFFNRAAEEITGCTSEQVLGRPLHDVFPDIARMLEIEPGSGSPRHESAFTRPDGTSVYLGFSVSILRNAADEAVGRIVIFQDLSEIRLLEEQMRRSERLAAVGQLSAAIAHEIRNPLASISGSVEMLNAESEASEDNQALMGIVLREVDRLNQLISDFLEYSRPPNLNRVETVLDDLVQDVLDLFRHRTGHRPLTVEFDRDAGRHVAAVDREAFRQVLWNLLNNAADATESAMEGHIRVEMENEDGVVLIAVEDSGTGVPDEHHKHIFEPFFTTKERGTGLGLATIYRVVEEHGGHISLANPHQLGGARFEIRLPTEL